MQNAVFSPGKKICALKKLAKTASSTVLANFFFGLIFQNFILQQALLCSGTGQSLVMDTSLADTSSLSGSRVPV